LVVIQNIIDCVLLNEDKLIADVDKFMHELEVGECELLIRIVSTAEITNLNKKYRFRENVTNVLAFATDIPKEIDSNILGDVVICADIVEQEAKANNNSFTNHITHLALHGLLHILGYDHNDDDNAEKMQEIEINLLKMLGIQNPYR